MRFIKSFFAGLGIGFGGAVALYVLAQVLDLIGCVFTCGNMMCFSQRSCVGQMGFYDSKVAVTVFAVSTIAGTVIGAFYGISKYVQEIDDERENKKKEKQRKEEAAGREYIRQQERHAVDFKQKVKMAVSRCEENRNSAKKSELQPIYECASLQGELWRKLHEVSVPLQELVDIVEEFSAVKGGKVSG